MIFIGLPKYIINIEELKNIFDGININANASTEELENILKSYFDKLIDLLKSFLKLKYIQKSIGLHSYIPALDFDYELIHKFDKDVIITGITYSQTGWKVLDCWDLYIGNKLLFDGIFTKELGEHKHFNSFYPVPSGTEIKIIHHNNSVNSKQIWFDIDYFEGTINNDSSENVNHDYNYKIVMRWEGGVNTDIDLMLYLSTGETLYYLNKEIIKDKNNRIWLDHDYTNHKGIGDREEKPEIITILGNPFEKAELKIRNYSLYRNNSFNHLKEDITIDIYKSDENNNDILIKNYIIDGSLLNENYDYNVCTIDLYNDLII